MSNWLKTTVCAAAVGTVSAFAASDQDYSTVEEALKSGEFDTKIGLYYQRAEWDDRVVDEEGYGDGFVEVEYKSGRFNGLQLGFEVLATGQLSEAEDGDYDGAFSDKSILREIELDYNFGTDSYLKIGRFEIKKAPIMDGDSHQGIELAYRELENLDIYFAVFDEWVNDAAWDDGIDDWDDVEDAAPDAGHQVFQLHADITINDSFSLTPYAAYQDDAAFAYGFRAALKQQSEEMTLGLVLDWYEISEDLDMANTADTTAYRAYASAEMSNGFMVGLGYCLYDDYTAGDTRLTTQSWLDDLGGVEEVDLAGFYTDDEVETCWLDLGYTYEKFSVLFQYAMQDYDEPAGADLDYDEWSINLGYDVQDNLALNLVYVDVDADTSITDDGYDYYYASAVYSF